MTAGSSQPDEVEALRSVLLNAQEDETSAEIMRDDYRHMARAVLASDWLAAHDARLIAAAEAEAGERIARAIEAEAGWRVTIQHAAAIARTAPATDRTEAGGQR